MIEFACMNCGALFMADSKSACPKCGSENVFELTHDCMADDPRWQKAERERAQFERDMKSVVNG